MSQSTDITFRIRQRFIEDVAASEKCGHLAVPLEEALSGAKAATVEQLIAIYQQPSSSGPVDHKEQEAAK